MTAGIGVEDFVLEESQASQASKDGQSRSQGGHGAELRREDFEFTTLLGEGAFARVLRARVRQDGREYAMKIVEKRMIQVQNRANRVFTERLMLVKMDHPRIVKLHFAFQDTWSLYFGLELVLGGDLATQIERLGTCSWDFTRFYTAEIIDILSYLRQCRVAHRDLKPENLLLTSEGHLKLVDFDAAMQVPDEGEGDAAGGRASRGEFPPAESFVGTALYVAPEVLLGTAEAEPQQAFALDVWALGCIVYLMTVGRTPFHAESEYLVFQRVQALDYTCPPRVWKKARQFIEGLLQLAPQQRLGAGEEGVADLQQHEFFSPEGYDEILRQTPPPRMSRPLMSRRRPEELEDILNDVDGISSAECTPEVGQRFRSSSSMKVLLAAQEHQQATQSFSESEATVQSEECFQSLALRRSEAPSAAPSAPSCHPSREGIPAAKQTVPSPRNLPSLQWLQDLLKRTVLMNGEDVRIGGLVVQRFIPCLRPRLLVLTDLPRLLVLDSRGRKVLRDVDLADSGGTTRQESMTESLNDKALNQKSHTDFEISLGRCRLRCRDTDLGAETWLDELSSARQLRHEILLDEPEVKAYHPN